MIATTPTKFYANIFNELHEIESFKFVTKNRNGYTIISVKLSYNHPDDGVFLAPSQVIAIEENDNA